ncbi:hypothetical protein PR202_gb21259 [Eleusine coracana subsp. coracana]|uniref:DUF4408 domain-containing protein n=1 Tax=Eleusine coracana subsp. coracana TaxID=191504 RepID=A0AAV5FCN0_ELECO|nr:hypothetical protein PR202_gb21259 [Eleusine coracana subsp. coracana]
MGYERTVKAATVATAVGALAAAAARFLGPAVADGLPRAREAAAAWMTPPYLYLVINAIIISIAASSRFQPGTDRPSAEPEPEQQHVAAVEPEAVPLEAVPVVPAAELVAAEDEPVVKGKKNKPAPAPKLDTKEEDEEFSISRSSWTPRRRGAEEEGEEAKPFADLTNSREKPLVSARFNRKPAKAKPSPEGKHNVKFRVFGQLLPFFFCFFDSQIDEDLGMCGCSRQQGSEGGASTEGGDAGEHVEGHHGGPGAAAGAAPQEVRHLGHPTGRRPSASGSGELDPAAAPAPPPPATAMRKAETFNDGRSKAPVRREPSLGQDELNRRVEPRSSVHHKFNMEMRLQRQESLKYHQEMLRLGRDGLY